MPSTRNNVTVLLTSLLLTVLIFGAGIALNYSFDFLRINSIVQIMNEHEVDSEAYLAQTEFISEFGGDQCEAMNSRIEDLKKEMKKVGDELATYGKLSFFKKKDFDYLKRKYSLLELKFLMIINRLNEQCGHPYTTILFFYEIDHDLSERQGYVLSEINLKYPQNVIVLSFDRGYTDEPLVKILMGKFNITTAPTTIIEETTKLEGLHYEEEIKGIVEELITRKKISEKYDPTYVLRASGINSSDFAQKTAKLAESGISEFAKGDAHFMIGRINNDPEQMCMALEHYRNAKPAGKEEAAILYESMAATFCGAGRKESLLKAAAIWETLGAGFRAEIDRKLASWETPEIPFEESGPYFSPEPRNASIIIIGNSSFTLAKEDVLVSQADRVTRDWLSYQVFSSPYSEALLTTFSERLAYTDEELLPEIGWHEGARIKELKETGLTHIVASGTVIAGKGGRWYAPDEKGIFRFEVPIDKVLYPTTRFLSEDIAVIIDTHGINSIVEQAVRNNASAVVGCCDSTAKIKAAEYLANRGVKVICFTDKYLPILLGKSLPILGSPPINISGGAAVLGGRPISVSTTEKIIAGDTGQNSTAQSYYDTPARYFRNLEMIQDLNVDYVVISRTGAARELTDAARGSGSKVIAARVFNSEDYYALKEWLEESGEHRAVLFHSMPYPYGYRILNEFPGQTSFGDISPIFK